MTLRIGVVGHRNHHLPEEDRAVMAARLHEALATIVRSHAGDTPSSEAPPSHRTAPAAIVVTALAEGADRMGAVAAEALGLPLHCPLPFRRKEYEKDFETEESRAEFRAFLARAAKVDELPGHRDEGSEAYARVGRKIVEDSDVLLVLWNGEPAQGPGGTGDVVDEAVSSMPVVWVPLDPAEPTRVVEGPSGQWKELSPEDLNVRLKRIGKEHTT